MSATALPGERTTPLTDRERALLNRLLSDPTIYPLSFKSWLIPYLEQADMDLPMGSVHGLLSKFNELSSPVFARMPAGTVLLFAGPEAPEGTEFHSSPQVQAAAPEGLRFIVVI